MEAPEEGQGGGKVGPTIERPIEMRGGQISIGQPLPTEPTPGLEEGGLGDVCPQDAGEVRGGTHKSKVLRRGGSEGRGVVCLVVVFGRRGCCVGLFCDCGFNVLVDVVCKNDVFFFVVFSYKFLCL